MNLGTQKILEALWPRYLGIPYKWGGDSMLRGLDCSGLVCDLLQSVGALKPEADLPASGLYSLYQSCDADPQFGDLVFFGKSAAAITHVGFVLDKMRMLEAGGGTKDTISLQDAIDDNAYVKVRPINHRRDLVGFKRPIYP